MDKDKMQCPEIEKACNDETITRNSALICQPTAESYRLNEIVQYFTIGIFYHLLPSLYYIYIISYAVWNKFPSKLGFSSLSFHYICIPI